MKKLLCILLSAIMFAIPLLSGIANISLAATDTLSITEFASEIGEMVESNDNLQYGSADYLQTDNEFVQFNTCRLIVKSSEKINTLNAEKIISGYEDLWILQFDTHEDTSKAFDYYSSRSGIEYVEIDKKVYALSAEETTETATESKYLSWGPEYIGIDKLNSEIINSNVELEEKVVAVIDTGVDSSHPFFNGRVIPTGVNTSTSGNRNDSTDDNGHGTQVAGVIIDSTLDNVVVKPYKVLDKYGQGTLITLAAGIISAVNDGVDVINMSIAFDESSEILKGAVSFAESRDIVLVGASGNDSSDTVYYPASYESVIKISAVNESGVISNFSTRGSDIDFAAPGVNIYTTSLNSGYKNMSGTSFAAPLVSALAAAMLSFDPELSKEDIQNILIENAVEVTDTDFKIKYGNGIVSAPELWDITDSSRKTKAPYFSLADSILSNEVNLEIFCDTPNSEIYYTTDRTVPSKTNPSTILYDGTPIHLSQTSVVIAVAYCDGLYRSAVSSFGSIIAPILSENNFTINESGLITAYNGTATSFTVPETVDGITVTGIGSEVFKGLSITEVILPDAVTSIGISAFEECNVLKTIIAHGVKSIGERAFYNCSYLKNIMITQPTSIGKYSFYNVCTAHFVLTGTTFNLNLNSVSAIPEGAFMESAISSLDITNISSIEKHAFKSCDALVSIDIDNLINMSNEAFIDCTDLYNVSIYGLSYIPTGAFSGCSSLVNVEIPEASYISARAFEKCTSLTQITLEAAETVYSNVFSGCKELRIIILPEMTGFESAVYKEGTTTFPKFSSVLEAFIAPKLTKTSAYMFSSSPNILAVSFRNLANVADNTFTNCKSMNYLNIQNVTNLSASALSGCEIDFIDARSLVTAEGLPDNSGIMLSVNFTGTDYVAQNLTVYGTSGSVAEQFADNNGYTFRPIPYIYSELPRYINDESGTVTVSAVGFDLEYQWYSNTSDSNQGGTVIEGANSETYTFTQSDTAYYYYCVITQNDHGTITEYATDVIIKDPKPAKYDRYNLAVQSARELNPAHYKNFEIVEEALSVDVSGKRSCEQRIVDTQAAAIRAAMANLIYNNVTSVSLKVKENSVALFNREKIYVNTYPADSVYAKIEWKSENTDIFTVTKNGYARCVGKGSTYIIAKVINHDGSYVVSRIKLTGRDANSWIESILSVFFRILFLLAANLET